MKLLNKWFPTVGQIPFDPAAKKGSLVFRHFNPKKVVFGTGKTLAELCPFAGVAWHGIRGDGKDPFSGTGTRSTPWEKGGDAITIGKQRCDALFEMLQKLGIGHYSWHNYDLAPEGATLEESHINLDIISDHLAELQEATGIGLAWGTCDHFSHPRYRLGVATGVSPEVYAYGLAEVYKMLEITKKLKGRNFVAWGGREGLRQIMSILMRMKFVLERYGQFGRSVCDYADSIGFEGNIMFEPKKREPMKVQYQSDVQTTLWLLSQAGLLGRKNVKLNLEENHAGLAGLDFAFEVMMAIAAGKLGSLDANEGDKLIGWDVDEGSHTVIRLVPVMLLLLEYGFDGNLVFDMKLRRESTDEKDPFWLHVTAMDTWAIATKVAAQIRNDRILDRITEGTLYAGWNTDFGKQVANGINSDDIINAAHKYGPTIQLPSGCEECINGLVNEYLHPAN